MNYDYYPNANTLSVEDMMKIIKQNNKYKEALEKYADMIVLDSEDHPHDVGMIARKTLEDHS
jgi:hypothetical protein